MKDELAAGQRKGGKASRAGREEWRRQLVSLLLSLECAGGAAGWVWGCLTTLEPTDKLDRALSALLLDALSDWRATAGPQGLAGCGKASEVLTDLCAAPPTMPEEGWWAATRVRFVLAVAAPTSATLATPEITTAADPAAGLIVEAAGGPNAVGAAVTALSSLGGSTELEASARLATMVGVAAVLPREVILLLAGELSGRGSLKLLGNLVAAVSAAAAEDGGWLQQHLLEGRAGKSRERLAECLGLSPAARGAAIAPAGDWRVAQQRKAAAAFAVDSGAGLQAVGPSVVAEWAGDTATVEACLTALQQMLAGAVAADGREGTHASGGGDGGGGPCCRSDVRGLLSVGMDTEWEASGNVALVQIAATAAATAGGGVERCWLVDTMPLLAQSEAPAPESGYSKYPAAVHCLLDWLLGAPGVRLLGFAFNGDASRLNALLAPMVLPNRRGTDASVVDIQRCAMSRWPGGGGQSRGLPSLKRVVETWLPGRTMDKAEQCSDWARRPLTESQLRCKSAASALVHSFCVLI